MLLWVLFMAILCLLNNTVLAGGLPGMSCSKYALHTCHLTQDRVVSFIKSVILCFNNTSPEDERKHCCQHIKWAHRQNEMVIPALWDGDAVFRRHFVLTCKNYSSGCVFKRSWVQSEGDIGTARDHIKHFNIWLQSKGAAGITAKTKNNHFHMSL